MNVEQHRGGFLEARHAVSAAAVSIDASANHHLVLDADGSHRTFWRSAAKPFQLLAVLEALEGSGHSENTPFTVRSLSDEDLAIGASSHSGGHIHLRHVQSLLDRASVDAAALQCGAEHPLDPTMLAELGRSGAAPSALHNDCSGKHALMLMACRARGWDLDGYLAPTHPMQRHVARTIARFVGEPHPTATDGCGVPTFWLSLHQMATAWAHLAAAMADPDEGPLLARIGHAMAEHPALTSGTGRIDLAVARRATGAFVGKIGALGVFCVAWPATRTGLAIKVHSGNEDALAVAVDAILPTVCPGALAPAATWPWHAVRNVVGVQVGTRHLAGLPAPAAPHTTTPRFDMSP